VAAARAGAPTTFIGAVGHDVFAEAAKKFHAAESIAAHFIVKPAHATGTAAILVNQAAQNEIVVAIGANEHLAPEDIEAALVREAKVVVCQHETNLAVNSHVFCIARAAGVTTVLNPAPMRPDFNPAILSLVDILIPNEAEFVALINLLGVGDESRQRNPYSETDLHSMAPAEIHQLCRRLGVPTVIVTLGQRGCLVSETTRHTLIAAHTDLAVVDTTGAGDAFVGGFAAALANLGGDVLAAARRGNAIAALSVTKFGTAPSMPTQTEIEIFWANHAPGETPI
jgi:ribokinase